MSSQITSLNTEAAILSRVIQVEEGTCRGARPNIYCPFVLGNTMLPAGTIYPQRLGRAN
jgi:hypothetical protein